MTTQISDTVIYKNQKYALIGIKGPELFEPRCFGLVSESWSTACYRGYYMTFTIEDTSLRLKQLTMLGSSKIYVSIDGIKPKEKDGDLVYKNLKLIISFTGVIRIAKDFIEEYYVHMGFQKAIAYKTVLDVKIENGKIVEVKNRSAEIEEKRKEFKKLYESVELGEAIAEAFSLDFG